MSEITINYKGSAIATMDASGTKTLLTQGKYCEGDVEIVYVRPSSSPTLQSKTRTYTPSGSQQTETVTADGGYDGLSQVGITVNATPSGAVTAPSTISASGATVSTGGNILTLSKVVSVTPSVTTAGYVSSGTAGNSNVELTASVTTQAATTYYPRTYQQTINGSRYLTGTQTFKAVTTSNLTAENIKDGVTIQVGDSDNSGRIASVTGTYDGGGGGGSAVLVVTVSYDENDGFSFDKTSAEIAQAYSDGDFVVVPDGYASCSVFGWSFDDYDNTLTLTVLRYFSEEVGEYYPWGYELVDVILHDDDSIDESAIDKYYYLIGFGNEAQPSDVPTDMTFYNSSGLQFGTA